MKQQGTIRTIGNRVGAILVTCLATFWLTVQPSLAEGDADSGAKLYKQYCRGCHGADGRGGAHTFMPHVGRLTERGYIDLLPDEYLFQVIMEGGQVVGKSNYMPAWQTTLSDEDVHDLIAHIRTLPLY